MVIANPTKEGEAISPGISDHNNREGHCEPDEGGRGNPNLPSTDLANVFNDPLNSSNYKSTMNV